jgi:hypothetical protein
MWPGLIRPSVAARRYDRWPTGWRGGDEWVSINESWYYATAVQDLGGLNAANIQGPDAIGVGIATLTLGCSNTSLTVKDALMVNIPVLAGAAAAL